MAERTLRASSPPLLRLDSSGGSASLYLTPDCTITPDVVPRPDPTADHSFAMPTYFDKKDKHKTAAAALVSAAVQPLANFHIFKQKSLNTIPALLDRHRKSEELFTNFPFLTPLANRKNSLVSAARLEGCAEDDFHWLAGEPRDVEPRANAAVDERQTSTPKDPVTSLRHSYSAHAR